MAREVDPSLDDPDAHDGAYPADWAARVATVLDRDDGRCVRCGAAVADDGEGPGDAPVERIVPTWRGGSNGIGNLLALCGRCSRRRRADGVPVVTHDAIETVPEAPSIATRGPGPHEAGLVGTDGSGTPECAGPALWPDPEDGWEHLLVPADEDGGSGPTDTLCSRPVRADPEPQAAALFGALEPAIRRVLGRSRPPAVDEADLEHVPHDADPLDGDRVCGDCAARYRDPTWTWPLAGSGYRMVVDWDGREVGYEPVAVVLAGGDPRPARRDVGADAPPVYDPAELADQGVAVVVTDRLGRRIRLDPRQVAGMAYERVVP